MGTIVNGYSGPTGSGEGSTAMELEGNKKASEGSIGETSAEGETTPLLEGGET